MTTPRDRAAQAEETKRLFGLSFLPEQINIPRPGGALGAILQGIIDPEERIALPGVEGVEFSPTLAATSLAILGLAAGQPQIGGTIGAGTALRAGAPQVARGFTGPAGGAARFTGVAPFSPGRIARTVGTGAAIGGGVAGASTILGALGGGDIPAQPPTEALGDVPPTEPAAEQQPSSVQDVIAKALQAAVEGGFGADEVVRPQISEIRLQTLDLPDGTQLFLPVGISIGPEGDEEIIDIGGRPLSGEEIQSRLASAEAERSLTEARAFAERVGALDNIQGLVQFAASPEGRLLLESLPPGAGIEGLFDQALGGGNIGLPQAQGRVTPQALGSAAPFFNVGQALPEEIAMVSPFIERITGIDPRQLQGVPTGNLQRTVTPSASVLSELPQAGRDLLSTALGITGESPQDLALAQQRLRRRR